MTWEIVDATASAAWQAAEWQQAQLEGLTAALGASPRLVLRNGSGELSRATMQAPTINTAASPRRIDFGQTIAGSLVHTAIGTPTIAEVTTAAGAVVLRASAGIAGSGAAVEFAGAVKALCRPSILIGDRISVDAWASLPAFLPAAASGTITTLGSSTFESVIPSGDRFDARKIISTWGTAALSFVRGAGGGLTDMIYWINGGGHGDTGYDGTILWRAATRSFVLAQDRYRLAPYSGANAFGEDDTAPGHSPPDNVRPVSHHPYQGHFALHSDEPNGPAMLRVRSSAAGQGALNYGQAHLFRYATGLWSRFGNNRTGNLSQSTPGAVIKDTLRELIVMYPADNGSAYYTLDYTDAAATWATLTASTPRPGGWSDTYTPCGCYHEGLDLYIAGNIGGTGGTLRGLNAASPGGNWVNLSFTGTALPASAWGWGLHYRSATGQVAIVDHSTLPPTGVFLLTPPASNPLSNAWTVSRVALTGVSAYESLTGDNTHYDRFQYVPDLDCLIVCPSDDAPMERWQL